MSKASYWQRGETLDYTNETEDKIEANSVIVLGDRIGVAGTDILPGELGSVHVTGVFEFPKGSGEIVVGTEVYYSESEGVITTDSSSDTKAGFAILTAADSETSVLVKINA